MYVQDENIFIIFLLLNLPQFDQTDKKRVYIKAHANFICLHSLSKVTQNYQDNLQKRHLPFVTNACRGGCGERGSWQRQNQSRKRNYRIRRKCTLLRFHFHFVNIHLNFKTFPSEKEIKKRFDLKLNTSRRDERKRGVRRDEGAKSNIIIVMMSIEILLLLQ